MVEHKPRIALTDGPIQLRRLHSQILSFRTFINHPVDSDLPDKVTDSVQRMITVWVKPGRDPIQRPKPEESEQTVIDILPCYAVFNRVFNDS